MTFARLTRGDWVAAVAALALLLVMALDWYGTDAGVSARKIEQAIEAARRDRGRGRRARSTRTPGSPPRRPSRTPGRPTRSADRLILFALLATVALAIAAAWLRAAGIRFEPPLDSERPGDAASGSAQRCCWPRASRRSRRPTSGAVVKLGAPLGLVCLGTIVLGARAAWNAERDGTAWGEAGRRRASRAHDPSPTPTRPTRSPSRTPLFDPLAGRPTPAVRAGAAGHRGRRSSPRAGARAGPRLERSVEPAGERGRDAAGIGPRGRGGRAAAGPEPRAAPPAASRLLQSAVDDRPRPGTPRRPLARLR